MHFLVHKLFVLFLALILCACGPHQNQIKEIVALTVIPGVTKVTRFSLMLIVFIVNTLFLSVSPTAHPYCFLLQSQGLFSWKPKGKFIRNLAIVCGWMSCYVLTEQLRFHCYYFYLHRHFHLGNIKCQSLINHDCWDNF